MRSIIIQRTSCEFPWRSESEVAVLTGLGCNLGSFLYQACMLCPDVSRGETLHRESEIQGRARNSGPLRARFLSDWLVPFPLPQTISWLVNVPNLSVSAYLI